MNWELCFSRLILSSCLQAISLCSTLCSLLDRLAPPMIKVRQAELATIKTRTSRLLASSCSCTADPPLRGVLAFGGACADEQQVAQQRKRTQPNIRKARPATSSPCSCCNNRLHGHKRETRASVAHAIALCTYWNYQGVGHVYRSGKTRYRPCQRRHRAHFDSSYPAKYWWLAPLSTLLMCTIDTARPFPKGRPTQPPQSTPGTWARTGPSARRSHGWVAKPAKLKPLTSRRSRVDAGGRKRARGSPRTALGTASASPIHVVMDEQSAGRSPRNADAGGPLMQ
jgi:hypothetical protein